jgi:hypothetical protein
MMDWSEWENGEQGSKRKTISPYWLIVVAIAISLAIVGALVAGKVYGATPTLIATDANGNWIRLKDEPCEHAKEWLKLRKAEMRYQGKDYGACWRAEGGTVLVFDDNGDLTAVPIQAFHREPEA